MAALIFLLPGQRALREWRRDTDFFGQACPSLWVRECVRDCGGGGGGGGSVFCESAVTTLVFI